MMNKLRNWYMGFMQGRYGERGMDEFGRFLNIATIVFILLSMIFRKVGIFYWIALALLIYEYYRILSRDFAKRRRENDRYLQIRYNRGAFFEDMRRKEKMQKHIVFIAAPAAVRKCVFPEEEAVSPSDARNAVKNLSRRAERPCLDI